MPPERPQSRHTDLYTRSQPPGICFFGAFLSRLPGQYPEEGTDRTLESVRASPADEVRSGRRSGRPPMRNKPAGFHHRGQPAGGTSNRRPGPRARYTHREPGKCRGQRVALVLEGRRRRAEGGREKSQEELIRQAESLQQSLDALRQSAEAAGVHDTAGRRQLPRSGTSWSGPTRPRATGRSSPTSSRPSRIWMRSAPRKPCSSSPGHKSSCARRWSAAASSSAGRPCEGDLANLSQESKEPNQKSQENGTRRYT